MGNSRRILSRPGSRSKVWWQNRIQGSPLVRAGSHLNLADQPDAYIGGQYRAIKSAVKGRTCSKASTIRPRMSRPPNCRLWKKVVAENQVGHAGYPSGGVAGRGLLRTLIELSAYLNAKNTISMTGVK